MIKSGGGFKAIKYSLQASQKVGFRKMYAAVSSKNTCKTCALGMGGQKGGMTNEVSEFPEICKKSFQAQITDIQEAIPETIFAEKSIAEFKNTKARLLEQTGRLNHPIYKKKGDSHYSILSWDEGYQKIKERFKDTDPDRSFFYSSGRSSNEAAFLLQLFARMYGTNNINNCSYYCHQATGVGLSATIGTGTATVQLRDLEKSDLIFVIGANPASNHPRFIKELLNCRRRGGKVVVINPAKEKGLVKFAIPSDVKSMLSGGSAIASEYIQNHIGGDVAILKGIAKTVIEIGNHDLTFMKKYTHFSQEYIEDIKSTSWERIVTHSGVSKKEIQKIGQLYGKAKNVVFSWAMGITHHKNGVDNVESIVSLALLRGMIGTPSAGLLPLRGHSNVQGIGSVGVTPVLKEAIFTNIEKHFNVQLPTKEGMDTMACMHAAEKGAIDMAFILGGNLYDSNPDSKYAEKSLNKIPFKIFLNTTLNHGHFHGVDEEVLILPVAARDEEKQATTQESMFNFVRMSDGGIVRLDNVHSEVDIISQIADEVLGKDIIDFEQFKKYNNLRKAIGITIPGFDKIADIDEAKTEFQIEGRTLAQKEFPTIDKKATFKVCPIPELKGAEGDFRMMSIRSEGQYNSIIYEEEDLYRNQSSRWVVLMNKEDLFQKGLKENDLVTLESSVGKMKHVKVRVFDIPSGNVMTYYPESNVLVSNATDPRSKTPGFKLTLVKMVLEK